MDGRRDYRTSSRPTRVYVGNLPYDVREREIDDLFYKFGRIIDIQVKRPERQPTYGKTHYQQFICLVHFNIYQSDTLLDAAFVYFNDARDAEDAVRYRDGSKFDGARLRVELSSSDRGAREDYSRSTRDSRRNDNNGWRQKRKASSEKSHRSSKSDKKRDDSDESHDDTVGHYTGGKGDRLNSFEVIQEVGIGTFGRVLECLDTEQNRKVAIKVVRSIKRYTESAAIEAGILKDVGRRSRDRDNNLCVELFGDFEFSGHYCLVFESLGRSLYDYLKKNDYQPFPFSMALAFTRQILEAVGKRMHEPLKKKYFDSTNSLDDSKHDKM